MDYRCMLVGSYLKSADFGNGDIPAQPTYKITNVALEKLETMSETDGAAGKLKTKGIVYLQGVDRPLVLNRTNAECLAAMFGRETNDWIGKRITLYSADVRVGAKMETGIRIKGSPDIAQEVTVSVKLPRRKAIPMRLVPTGSVPAALAAAIAAATTVEALKHAWAENAGAEPSSDAKAAYTARLAQVRPPKTVAVPMPDDAP